MTKRYFFSDSFSTDIFLFWVSNIWRKVFSLGFILKWISLKTLLKGPFVVKAVISLKRQKIKAIRKEKEKKRQRIRKTKLWKGKEKIKIRMKRKKKENKKEKSASWCWQKPPRVPSALRCFLILRIMAYGVIWHNWHICFNLDIWRMANFMCTLYQL